MHPKFILNTSIQGSHGSTGFRGTKCKDVLSTGSARSSMPWYSIICHSILDMTKCLKCRLCHSLSSVQWFKDVLAHLASGICLKQHDPSHASLKVTKVGASHLMWESYDYRIEVQHKVAGFVVKWTVKENNSASKRWLLNSYNSKSFRN